MRRRVRSSSAAADQPRPKSTPIPSAVEYRNLLNKQYSEGLRQEARGNKLPTEHSSRFNKADKNEINGKVTLDNKTAGAEKCIKSSESRSGEEHSMSSSLNLKSTPDRTEKQGRGTEKEGRGTEEKDRGTEKEGRGTEKEGRGTEEKDRGTKKPMEIHRDTDGHRRIHHRDTESQTRSQHRDTEGQTRSHRVPKIDEWEPILTSYIDFSREPSIASSRDISREPSVSSSRYNPGREPSVASTRDILVSREPSVSSTRYVGSSREPSVSSTRYVGSSREPGVSNSRNVGKEDSRSKSGPSSKEASSRGANSREASSREATSRGASSREVSSPRYTHRSRDTSSVGSSRDLNGSREASVTSVYDTGDLYPGTNGTTDGIYSSESNFNTLGKEPYRTN